MSVIITSRWATTCQTHRPSGEQDLNLLVWALTLTSSRVAASGLLLDLDKKKKKPNRLLICVPVTQAFSRLGN